mmetsp:Transcript_86226/g.189413  ORF Transcript_86226/g.189413 Transcript_86226/m.189413 type:complete len:213 (-) Transcript_86226:921-1559(-)
MMQGLAWSQLMFQLLGGMGPNSLHRAGWHHIHASRAREVARHPCWARWRRQVEFEASLQHLGDRLQPMLEVVNNFQVRGQLSQFEQVHVLVHTGRHAFQAHAGYRKIGDRHHLGSMHIRQHLIKGFSIFHVQPTHLEVSAELFVLHFRSKFLHRNGAVGVAIQAPEEHHEVLGILEIFFLFLEGQALYVLSGCPHRPVDKDGRDDVPQGHCE